MKMKKRVSVILAALSLLLVGISVTAPIEAYAAGSGWCSASTYTRSDSFTGMRIYVPSAGVDGPRNCVMWEPARSDAVKAMQAALTLCNWADTKGTDGIWGPNTTAALKQRQRQAGIAVDGEYGPQSHNAMWFSDVYVPHIPTAYDCAHDYRV